MTQSDVLRFDFFSTVTSVGLQTWGDFALGFARVSAASGSVTGAGTLWPMVSYWSKLISSVRSWWSLNHKNCSRRHKFSRDKNSQEKNHVAYMNEYTQSEMSSSKDVRTNCGSGRSLMTHSVMNALCFTGVRKGGRASTCRSILLTSSSGLAVCLLRGSERQNSLAT